MNDEEGCEVVKGSEGEVIMIEVVLMEELSEVWNESSESIICEGGT